MWSVWWGLLRDITCGEDGGVCLVVWHVDRVVGLLSGMACG